MGREIVNVAIYVRKSREEETEETLNRQKSFLIELCVKNVWKYEIFQEIGSSQEIDRPELQKMLDKVKLFHYDGIVVADLDRLSRNTVHFGTIKEIMLNAGCCAITPSKVYDFSKQEDDLFSDLQSVLAKNEYQTIKKRLIRGVRQSAKDGNWMGKKVPVGYNYNRSTKKLEFSEDAPVIKRMFMEYLNGLSTKEIANKFTAEGVSTVKGIIWTPAGISRLLNNVVYKGDSLYGKTKYENGKRAVKTNVEEQILIEDTHPAIIDKVTWDKIQQIKLERNSRPVALKVGKRKFSGLIKCGLCGQTHSFQTSRYKRKRINSCQTRHYEDDTLTKYTLCKNESCNLEEFEIGFFKELSKIIEHLKEYRKLIEDSEPDKKDSPIGRIASLEKQIKKIQQEIKRVQQGFIMKIFTDVEAEKEINKYRLRQESLENEIKQLSEIKDNNELDYVDETIEKLTRFFSGHDKMDEVEANEILRENIESIIYQKHEGTNSKIIIKIIPKQ